MKKKKIISGAIFLIIIGLAAYFFLHKNSEELKYRTEKLSRGDIESSITATGTVNAVKTVLVGTQVSGTISRLYVDFNSSVRQGQLLAQIEPAAFQSQVDQAKASLLLAEANVEKAKALYDDARRNLERNRQLLDKNLIAVNDVDSAETNFQSANAQLNASKAQVKQAQAALRMAETNLRYTNIVSPVDGMVISRAVDIGQTVAASFQTPTLFNIAQDLKKMQIDTNVDEADIGEIREGQAVEFTVDAYPEKVFRGKVEEIRNAPITVSNVVTYDVIVKVDNQDLRLKPGMTANVIIVTNSREGVLKAPNAALRFKMPDGNMSSPRKKGPSLWVMEKNKPRQIPVTIGISDGKFTEVEAAGIREDMAVIVAANGKENEKPRRASGPGLFR